MIEYDQKDMDRFRSKIFEVVEGEHKGCYETTYAKDGGGYARFRINSKIISAHRLMYQIWHPDENIDTLKICHRCDNPACVNHEHLFSGTQQDNMDDRSNKNRQAKLKGSENGNSKLTEGDIVEMLNLTLSGHFTSYEAIAEHYKVSISSICFIITQKFWKHVTKDFDMVKVKSLLDNRTGTKSPNAKLNEAQVREIRLRLKNGEKQQILANFYGVHKGIIGRISTGKIYKDVV